MFSWAGAGKFETKNVDDLIEGGASGSGDFAAFLLSVFGGEADKIVYQGLRESPQGRFALFNYNVPLEKSQYTYHTTGANRIIGYSGTFLVDPDNAELQRLTVETSEFPAGESACRVEHTMDYHRVKIGSGNFMLPEVTVMDVLFRNGGASHNETVYSDCREFAGETTIRFDDVDASASAVPAKAALPPLPPHTGLRIALEKTIDTASAAAGDEVTGLLQQDVRDKSGVIAHRNDRVRGRILQMEQAMGTTPRWVMAIRSIPSSATANRSPFRSARWTTARDRRKDRPADRTSDPRGDGDCAWMRDSHPVSRAFRLRGGHRARACSFFPRAGMS